MKQLGLFQSLYLKKLSEEFPNEFIEVKFADEDIYSNNNGKITYIDGLPTISNSLGEKFAKEVWNENIEKRKRHHRRNV